MNKNITVGSMASSRSSNRWFSAGWTAVGGAILGMVSILMYLLIISNGNLQSRSDSATVLETPLGGIFLGVLSVLVSVGFIVGYCVDVPRLVYGFRYITAGDKEYIVKVRSEEIQNVLKSSSGKDDAETRIRQLLLEVSN